MPRSSVLYGRAIMRGPLDDEKAKAAALSQQGDVVVIGAGEYGARIEKEEAAWATLVQREAITLD